MPKISVIVAVYNVREDYFRQCMGSLVNQTMQDIEIILIDDGSREECARLCDEYAKTDERVVVIHKQNEGVSIASNLGISIAKGEYLTFVDNDDWVTEDMCEKAYGKICSADADVAVWMYNSYSKDGVKRGFYKGPEELLYEGEKIQRLQAQIIDVFAYDEQQISLAGSNWCKLYRTGMLKMNEQARFPEHMMGGEDAIFTFRALSCASKVVFFNEAMYYYRQNEQSYTKRYKPDMLQDELRMLRMYEGIVKGNQKLELCWGKATCNSFIGIGTNFIFHRENQMSYSQKRAYLKHVASMDVYHNALQHVKEYHFGKAKALCLNCAKNRLWDITLLLIYIYMKKSAEERYE